MPDDETSSHVTTAPTLQGGSMPATINESGRSVSEELSSQPAAEVRSPLEAIIAAARVQPPAQRVALLAFCVVVLARPAYLPRRRVAPLRHLC